MRWRRWIAPAVRYGAVAAVAVALVNGFLFFYGGFTNLSAIQGDRQGFFDAIGLVRDTTVAWRASEIEIPPDFEPAITAEGLVLYEAQCAVCHGAPGLPPRSLALGMNPVPPNLVASARRRPTREVYWFIKNGVRMTGMPAWGERLTEEELWALTAFVEALPDVVPAEYADIVEPLRITPETLDSPSEPEAEIEPLGVLPSSVLVAKGRTALRLYGCRSCHIIPGIVGRDFRAGPSLEGAASRRYIAGVLANTPTNMIRWIMDPKAVDPLTAMPDLDVTEADARAMVAYLYSREVGSERLPPVLPATAPEELTGQ